MVRRFQQFIREYTNAAAITDTTPTELIDFEGKKNVDDYGEFNGLDFKNNSTNDVDVFLNGNPHIRFRVTAGQGLNIDPSEDILYRTFTIVRVNAIDIAVGEVRAQVQRVTPRVGVR